MMFYGSGVGTPVTRSPRHRPGRAVFSHPVPRLHSLIKRTVTVTRFTVQLFSPRSEVCSCIPDPACPARVSFASCVLPSGPSPCGRLSRPQTTMPDKTPRRHAAVPRLPVRSLFHDSTRAHAVSGLFTRSCPSPVGFIGSPRTGAFGASRVLERLSSCIHKPEDSGGHPHAHP
jgi:hypothetical protein